MTPNCAVCEEPMAPANSHCDTCGFPTALSAEASRTLSEPEAPAKIPESSSRRPLPAGRASGPSAADSQSELCQRLAVELRVNLELLGRLGGAAPALVSEMSQAALTQADGRLGEALSLLRNAHSRVILQASELFERRVGELERRQRALGKDGVAYDMTEPIAEMRKQFEDGNREGAILLLSRGDQQLGRVESDWNGLRGLLQQIDSLREAAQAAGHDLPQVEADVRQVREILAIPSLGTDGLDAAAQTAARALMLLHEALPPVIERELERQGARLDTLPSDHVHARRARTLHAEATRHLRRGRLADASARLKELQEAIRLAGAEPLAGAGEDSPPSNIVSPSPGTGDPDTSTEFLGRLLQKARGLAARVRSLPPESDVAFEAAAEIRRATELLRARKLEDAESTLSRLMRTLDAEHPAEV